MQVLIFVNLHLQLRIRRGLQLQTTTGRAMESSKDHQNKEEVALSPQQRDRMHLLQYLKFARKQLKDGLSLFLTITFRRSTPFT